MRYKNAPTDKNIVNKSVQALNNRIYLILQLIIIVIKCSTTTHNA